MDELEQLHGMAALTDQEAEPVMPEGPALDEKGQPLPPPPDYANEAAGAVDFFAALVVGYCPSAEKIWTTETKGRISAALGPVMEKYGVTIGTLPPEITLLLVAGPPLWQSSKLLAAQIEADKQKAVEAPQEQRQMPPPESGAGPVREVHTQMGLYK